MGLGPQEQVVDQWVDVPVWLKMVGTHGMRGSELKTEGSVDQELDA